VIFLTQCGYGNKVLQPQSRVISVVAVSPCYRVRVHGVHPKQTGASIGRFLNLKGCIVQDPTAPRAQNQHAAFRREINFDFEVEPS
jgi:hypothetical protein